jgi:hypothetical protein
MPLIPLLSKNNYGYTSITNKITRISTFTHTLKHLQVMSRSQQHSEKNYAQELHQQHTSQMQQQFTQTNMNSRGRLSRPLVGVWTDENGGPGPAAWRMQGTGTCPTPPFLPRSRLTPISLDVSLLTKGISKLTPSSNTGNIRGLARKKGVKAFWKTGFDVDDSVLSHPLFQPHTELPSPSKKSKGLVSPKSDGYSSDTGLLREKKKGKGQCSVM